MVRWARRKAVAAYSVHSPPQPTPACRGWPDLYCRERASPQPAGEGLGVGVVIGGPSSRHNYDPPPNPPPQGGREHTECAACVDPISTGHAIGHAMAALGRAFAILVLAPALA